jgi:TRAP-type C4-dicarboxylate transport system permease small subunit
MDLRLQGLGAAEVDMEATNSAKNLNPSLEILNRIAAAAGKIAGILSFALVFFISADVVLRYFFNTPIPGTHESSRLTLAWICFLGVFYGYTVDAHVRVTLITRRFPDKESSFEVIACGFGLLIFGFLGYDGLFYFWDSWINREVYPAQIPVPHWLAKLATPLGAFFIFLTLLVRMIAYLYEFSSKKG